MQPTDFASLGSQLLELTELPGGIEKVRALLADYATSGRLVPAAGPDQSVDDLLDVIREEKRLRGLKGGVTVIPTPEELDIPESWRLVALGDVLEHCRNGTSASPNDAGEGYPLLRISAGTSRRDGMTNMADYKYAAISSELATPYILKPGDLLACRFNGNLHFVGKVSQVPDDLDQDILHPDKLIRLQALVLSHAYLRHVLNSRFVRSQIESVAATTAGNIGVNGKQMKALVIPVAPLSEQIAIAEQLDRASIVLDELALNIQDRNRSQADLAAGALHRFGESADDAVLELLHEVLRTPGDVSALEVAVLQLAVTGALSRPSPGDGQASDLITAAKDTALDSPELLTANGKHVPDPYPLPASWEWVALGAVLNGIQAGWSPSAQPRPKEGDEWGVLKVSACSWGIFKPEENKAMLAGEDPRPGLEVKAGDFLISRANTSELVARSVVVDDTPPHLMLSDKTLRMSVVEGCNPRYLNLANLANTAREHYQRDATGTSSSMLNVSQKVIRRTPIPLPPSAVQDRIVETVDRITELIRLLRSQLAA